MPKQETIAVPVEVVRELKALRMAYENARIDSEEEQRAADRLSRMVGNIPDPPKPDVVEECFAAWARGQGALIDTSKERMRAALRRYRELGCPELDE